MNCKLTRVGKPSVHEPVIKALLAIGGSAWKSAILLSKAYRENVIFYAAGLKPIIVKATCTQQQVSFLGSRFFKHFFTAYLTGGSPGRLVQALRGGFTHRGAVR